LKKRELDLKKHHSALYNPKGLPNPYHATPNQIKETIGIVEIMNKFHRSILDTILPFINSTFAPSPNNRHTSNGEYPDKESNQVDPLDRLELLDKPKLLKNIPKTDRVSFFYLDKNTI
jgi:hypothetical protein